MMKKINLSVVFSFFTLFSVQIYFGQINVGVNELNQLASRPFKQNELDLLKKSKTIFVYRECDKANLDFFKKTINEAWDYTELEFVSHDEFLSKKIDQNNSFFTIDGVHKVKTSSSGMITESTYIYLKLWMKDNGKELVFCQIYLYPTFETYKNASIRLSNMIGYLYDEAVLHNWNSIFLKNSLQYVNKKLSNSSVRSLYKNEVNLDSLSILKYDTLHIIDYSLIKFNPKNGDESERHEITSLLSKYPYPYKLISIEEFTEKDLNTEKPLYYLSYVKNNANKFVSVFNSKTGDILCSFNSVVSYNLTPGDFIKISKFIKKSK